MFCGSSSMVIVQSIVVGVVAPFGRPCNASVWCDSSGVLQWWVEKCGVCCVSVWCVCPVVWSQQTRGGCLVREVSRLGGDCLVAAWLIGRKVSLEDSEWKHIV